MTPQTLVIAHRGASGVEPENTIRAFERAYQMGADGIELDVFLTKDKQIVVTHDQNTLRLTGSNSNICFSTLKELRQLDFGKGEKIPLLEEVFDHFLEKFSVINIEIKSTGFFSNGIEEKLAQLIKSYSCTSEILVSSFNPFNLYRFKKLMPEVRLGYLLSSTESFLTKNSWALHLLKPQVINLDKVMANVDKDKFYFDVPLPKWIWTVNTEMDMEHWAKEGVEAIITNYPDRLRSLIK